jgi:hypothetical protein
MKTRLSVIIAAMAALFPFAAGAKDSAFRSSVAQSSARAGQGRTSLRVLSRVAGPGRAAAAAAVLSRAESIIPGQIGRAVRDTRELEDGTLVRGEGFVVDIRADGSAVRFETLDHTRGGQAPGVPEAKRLSPDLLEKLGRSFIAEGLKQLVVVGPEEELVPWYTSYEIEVSGTTVGEAPLRKVVANRIVFTRTIDGVPVVGPGSKVSVTFANDEAPVAFSYDWSQFADSGETETQASLGVVRARQAFAAKAHGPRLTFQKMECGYYDSGAKGDRLDQIRGACITEQQYIGTNGIQSMVYADAIPSALEIPKDSGWSEALFLRKVGAQ